jgi:MFS transporter, FHS family, L-fucose permease
MTPSRSYTTALLIICALFFFFGFITWVNGVLIPYFQICLELSNFQASLVLFASYSAYFVMALPSARILQRTGYKRGMVIGLLVMAAGTLLFVPAAYGRTYGLFLFGLYLTGTGLTLLQAAANPYIAVIGPIESTAQRVGFLGLSNKIAGILCITLLGSIFLLRADDVLAQIQGVSATQKAALLDAYVLKIVNPYLVITAALVVMAVFIHFTHLPDVDDTAPGTTSTSQSTDRASILHYPHLLLGVLTLFLATACEMIPIDSVIIYGRALGLSIDEARQFPNYGLAMMLLGYLASIFLIPKYVSQQQALQFAAVWGLMLALTAFAVGGTASMYCLVAMGFGTALLWGTIWGLALQGLGRHTKTGGALLLMAVIGGAVLPLVFGRLIDLNPDIPQRALLLMLPLYGGILAYSVWGYKLTKQTANHETCS